MSRNLLAENMALWLRSRFLETQVVSLHYSRWLKTTYNSSIRGSNALCWCLWIPANMWHTRTQTNKHTNINKSKSKSLKKNKKPARLLGSLWGNLSCWLLLPLSDKHCCVALLVAKPRVLTTVETAPPKASYWVYPAQCQELFCVVVELNGVELKSWTERKQNMWEKVRLPWG